ncbi:hypothetical Protein YC6258_05453 [Gynuella sunshinyii YC6258]|uniref:Uncharacterized protein n=1 Tax=Gynuella sunshinyii YC6258 TaxID=1445510 RepID=A0A0C5VVY2_9GAMM|nr:hypothetical Protein YC6258_05453 [Gynuella sunshinyii YC6258]
MMNGKLSSIRAQRLSPLSFCLGSHGQLTQTYRATVAAL